MGKYISQSVIRRLPKYYRYLRDLEKNGVDRVSSSMLANALGFTASQVRQDFSCFGGFGQQGYGYKVGSLLEKLGEIIGINRRHTCAIIGVGNLGRALMCNFRFPHCGFELVAAFDADKSLAGKEFGGITVSDMDDIEEYFAKNQVDVAVLTVPKEHVRDVAKRVAGLGISGIWNFTHIDLSLEELGVQVENVHFAESLMTLCYGISLGEDV